MITCTVLPHEVADGPANMAIDEALLEAVATDPSRSFFRTYEWTVPTLSLGYFQSVNDVRADPRWREVPFVRRPTGGGAIWHDRELTYALVVPAAHPAAKPGHALYQAVHAAIAMLLREQGVTIDRRGDAGLVTGPRARPFLCFSDRDAEDLVAGESKLVGSAQRRRHGALLQHGSILTARSPTTPEIPGIEEVAGVLFAPSGLSSSVSRAVTERLGLERDFAEIAPQIRSNARVLEDSVYRSNAWTYRR